MTPAGTRRHRALPGRVERRNPLVRRYLVAFGLVIGVTSCGDDATGERVTVFAAASLADVMAATATAFTEETGIEVQLNVAGSSALRLQLDEGARGDVYVPADPAQLELLEAPVDARPTTIASNELVVAHRVDEPSVELGDFDEADLLLGACAPQVPCGRYASIAFDAASITAALDTEEADVRSLSSKIADGDLDAGLVYVTDVTADDRLTATTLPDDVRSMLDIVYVAAPLADGAAPELGDRFIDFLTGDTAQGIFRAAGFGTP